MAGRSTLSSVTRQVATVALFVCTLLDGSARADTVIVSAADTSQLTASVPVNLNFPISLAGDTTYDVAFDYSTIDASAHAGVDYVATSGFALLAAGTTNLPIPVSLNPIASGADLTFQLQLAHATGIGPAAMFAGQQRIAAAGSPQSFAFADINGDGKPDLLITDLSPNAISVRLNTTTPGATVSTFSAGTSFSAGGDAGYVTTADINGDGRPDIVTLNVGPVSVLLNTTPAGATTPSFSPMQRFPAGAFPGALVVADFNGDGKPDFAVSSPSTHEVVMAFNTTPGGATTASFSSAFPIAIGNSTTQPMNLAALDIDGDGKVDLAVVDQANQQVYAVRKVVSNYVAGVIFATGAQPQLIAAADVNGDGRPDLVVTDNATNVIQVALNATSSGIVTFRALQPFAGVAGATSLRIVDVNGDGKPDVILSSSANPLAGVLINRTAPGSATMHFSPLQTFTTAAAVNFAALADVNGDGLPDVVTAHTGDNSLSVLLNSAPAPAASVNFTAPQIFTTDFGPSAIVTADFNGDGIADAVSVNNAANSVSVLFGTTAPGAATPTFATAQTFAVGGDPAGAVVADFNADGRPDIAVVNGSGTVSVLLNTTWPGAMTPSFGTQVTFAVGQSSNAIVAYDVNGDGLVDLVVSNFADNTISVLLNTSPPGGTTANFAAQQTFATPALPNALAVGDVNRDGKRDVLVTSFTGNVVAVLLNNTTPGSATAAFASPQTFATGTDPDGVVVADFNGDGIPDLATANNISNNVSVLFGTTLSGATTCTFAPAVNFPVGIVANGISAADLDGDGRIDLLVANYASSTISLLKNTTNAGAATPSFAAQRTFATGSGPYAVTTADIDGDGKPDILTANRQGPSISVLLNTQYRATIATSTATGTILHDVIFRDGFD